MGESKKCLLVLDGQLRSSADKELFFAKLPHPSSQGACIGFLRICGDGDGDGGSDGDSDGVGGGRWRQ